MKILPPLALLVVLLLSGGCAALGLAYTTTPAGARVKLLAKYSIQEIEREIDRSEAFDVIQKDDGGFTASTTEIPRYPTRKEWVPMKARLQPGDQLWYFYGPAHGWGVRRAGRFVNFLIIEESPERKRANQSVQRTPGKVSFAAEALEARRL